MYRYIRIIHSAGGKWSNLEPELPDLFFTFVPIVNTGFALIASFVTWRRYPKSKFNYSKFFNIKK